MNTQIQENAALLISNNWATPSPLVGSGHDARSSENGLLSIMYGSLERASRFDWLNAGRTLVDKTYINILLQAAELDANGVTTTELASRLDAFVRAELEPLWAEFEGLEHDPKHQLAVELVDKCAATVLGSGHQPEAASWLLYYLCPQLPVFPMHAALKAELAAKQDLTVDSDYADFHAACRRQFARALPHIHSPAPAALYGDKRELEIINQILRGSDWWQRRCFLQHLITAA